MTATGNGSPSPQIVREQGRSYVVVPYGAATQMHAQLNREGCRGTLCLDPAARQARIELWEGVDPERALAVLEGEGAGPPRPDQKAA